MLRRKKAKSGQNALFHLLQNAPTPALIYHDFVPTSTHAHNYITRSLDSLHPNEKVYMHFNIKKSRKSRVKAQKGKSRQNALFHLLQNAPTPALIYHDFLPTSTHAHNYITRYLDSLHPNEQDYMHFNFKRVEKVVLRRKKAKVGKTDCFTCFKMRLHLRWSTTIFSQLPHMRTTISPDLWIVYIPMNRSACILTLKESKKSC